jgi:enoyl-CoA hydratase/carnithine racemase
MIRREEAGGVRVIRIDRPQKRNALTPVMIAALRDQVRAAGDDPTVRGLILAGVGPSTCAGVDLNEFASGTSDSVRSLIRLLADTCAAIRQCPKPVAIAIQGSCLGAGLELACACDLRVAAPDALLGMPEVLLGIPSVIDAALIELHIGLGRAQELIMTGDPIDAEMALAWGLVNRVAPADRVVETCRELLDRVVRHDAATIGRQKRLFAEWQNLPLDDAIGRSQEALVESFAGGLPQRLARERLERC